MSKPSQNRHANSRKALIGSSVAALGYALLASTSASAQAVSADGSIKFISGPAPVDAALIAINDVNSRALGYDFTLDSSLPGYTWNGTTVQSAYNPNGSVLQIGADITSTAGAGGIYKQLTSSSYIPDPADISLNTILANAYGNNALPDAGSVTFDLGLLSTIGTAGTLIVQYTGNEQNQDNGVSVASELSDQFVGVDYTGQAATELAVSGNQLAAQSALNTATTLVAGAVPFGYDTSAQGGSSTISLNNGQLGFSSSSSIGLNTVQVSQNAGISSGSAAASSTVDAGSYAMVSGSSVAVQANASSSGSLSAPITLNSNAIAAQFTGNSANSVFESASSDTSPANEFNGSVSVTNAQANVDNVTGATGVGLNALVSDSNIVADLTYQGVSSTSGSSTTTLSGSLSVSGTAQDLQLISASAIGNLAGSVTSTGELDYYGNAISFTDSTVNLNGTGGNYGGVLEVASGGASGSADLLINSLQVNTTDQGVRALVDSSLVYAAVDNVAANGSITASYNAVTSQVTGNAAGNLVDVAANNIDATVAIANNQRNDGSNVSATTSNSGVLIGVGIAADNGYTVANRDSLVNVVGNITSENNLIAATAQGNLAANSMNVDVANTMSSSQGINGASSGWVAPFATYVDAGLAISNMQTNDASSVSATLNAGGVKIDLIDQAGYGNNGLVELGNANVSLSGNAVAAKAEGNAASTTIAVNGGTDLALTAATMNAQQNDGSNVTAAVNGSDVLVTALSTNGTVLTTQGNSVTANAVGNSAINTVALAGGNVVNGTGGLLTAVKTDQYNNAYIGAGTDSASIGLLVGGISTNVLSGNTDAVSDAHNNIDQSARDFSWVASNVDTYTYNEDFATITDSTISVDGGTIASAAIGSAAVNGSSLSGTVLGNDVAIESSVNLRQSNSAQISATVASNVIGVALRSQENSVTLSNVNSATATTSNWISSISGGYAEDIGVEASATATVDQDRFATTDIRGIVDSTIAVNNATLAGQSTANSALNSATISGTTVIVANGTMQRVDNVQYHNGSTSAYATNNKVGVTISAMSGVSSLSETTNASATAAPTNASELADGYADTNSVQNVSGSTTAIAVDGLNATIDGAQVLATATGNAAANSFQFSATDGAPASTVGTGLVYNDQSSQANGSATITLASVGLEIDTVTAMQDITVTGTATSTLTGRTTNQTGYADYGEADAYGMASGDATAIGQLGGGSTVTDAIVSAEITGNRVNNTITVGGTNIDRINFAIDNNGDGQTNSGNLEATLLIANVGIKVGNVLASGVATVEETVTLTASASGDATATATGNDAWVDGDAILSVTATGISSAINNTSRNALGAMVTGNDSVNRIDVNVTSLMGAASNSMMSIGNKQDNFGVNTASVSDLNVGTRLGTVGASGSASLDNRVSTSALADPYIYFGSTATAGATANADGNVDVAVRATGVTGLTDTIADNSVKSMAVGNNAANTISLSGTNVTGGAGSQPGISNWQWSNASQTATLAGTNVGLVVDRVWSEGNTWSSGSASATASATTNPYSGSSSSASATSDFNADGSATSIGVTGSNVTVSGNDLIAANSGNVAANRIAASSTTLNNLGISNSNYQSGSGTLTATVGGSSGVQVGVNVGDIVSDMESRVSGSGTGWVDTRNGAYATSKGLVDSTFSVTSNNVSALNFANDAVNSVAVESSVLGTALLPTSVSQSNAQDADGGLSSASVLGLELGVVVGNVSSYADTWNYNSNNDPWNSDSWSNTGTVSVGIDNVTVTVGGTANSPQLVRAQSVGNNAANAIVTTDTTGAGSSTTNTLLNTNSQDNWADYSARVGNATYGTLIGVSVGNVTADSWRSESATGISGSNVTVAYNQVDALAFANSVTNLVSASSSNSIAGNTSGDTIVNSNDQWSDSGSSTTATVENLDLGTFVGNISTWSAGGSVQDTTISVSNNSVSAAAYGNGSENLLGNDAQVIGSASAPISTRLYNEQDNSGGRSATVNDVRLGLVAGTTNGANSVDGLFATLVTVEGNALAAETFGNSARSLTSIAADNTIALGNVLTSNVQNNTWSGGSSTLSDILVGTENGNNQWASTIVNSTISVSGNALTSRSIGNYADSRTNVSAGNSLSVGSGFAGSSIASTNDQFTNGSLTASASNVAIGLRTNGTEDAGVYNSPITVSGNSLAIISAQNLATTVATAASVGTIVNSINTTHFIRAENDQVASGVVEATGANITVGPQVTASNVAIQQAAATTSGNLIEAMATGNAATISATLAAATTLDGAGDASTDALVTSDQEKSGEVTASLTGVRVGMMVSANQDILDSNLTVDGNTVSAMARGNVATNQLAIEAQQLGRVDTSVKGAVSNAQSNSASGSASLNNVSVGLAPLSGNAVDTTGATIAATNNALNAVAGGNTAANVLNATATATIAAAEGYGFRVLNSQSNSANMIASATDTKIGTWSGTGAEYGRTTTTVSYNTLNVAAYGNSAINALNVSALNGSQSGASGAAQNSQQSYANISATVQNAQIGSGATYAGGGAGGVISNSINATATGNIANTSIGIVR